MIYTLCKFHDPSDDDDDESDDFYHHEHKLNASR